MVEHAPCPVGVVKGRVGGLDRLLLCDSGVQEAPVVDQLVARLPDLVRGAREITVLHLMSQMLAGPTVPEGHEMEAQAADLIAAPAGGASSSATWRTRSWPPWIGRCWSCAPRAAWSETWGRAEVELRRGVKRVEIVEPIAV